VADKIKNYGINGTAENIELGKGNAVIFGSAELIGVFNSADILAVVNTANAVELTHAVTKGQLDPRFAEKLKYQTFTVNYDSGTINLATATANTRIVSVVIEADAEWIRSDVNTTITVGDSNNNNRLFTGFDPEMQSSDNPDHIYRDETVITAYVQGGDAIAGNATVTIWYIGTLNPPPSAPTYSITPNVTAVDEGNAVTMSVVTTNFGNGVLYWNTLSSNSADFDQSIGVVTITNNTGSFTIIPTADFITEGEETFSVQLRIDSNVGTVVATSEEITINDTSTTPTTYSITPDVTAVDEGNAVTISVATTDFGNGVLYWNILHESSNSEDFVTNSGTVTITNNAGSFIITTTADLNTEGAETFRVQLRTDSNEGLVVANSAVITIIDTSVAANITYSINITSDVTAVDEGNTVTFSVATTDFGNGTLYYTTQGVTFTGVLRGAVAADFEGNVLPSGNVNLVNDTGNVVITTRADGLAEGAEGFRLQIRKDSVNGVILATSNNITINDTSRPQFGVTASSNTVNEGDSITFTVTTENAANQTLRFRPISNTSTRLSAVTADNFDNINGVNPFSNTTPISFSLVNNLGTFTIPIKRDFLTTGGSTWSTHNATAANAWQSVAYGNGVWVAVSSNGADRVMRSTDGGITWSAVAAAEANAWQSVAYGNGVWVAVSSNGTNRVMRSTDGGVTWSAVAAAEANAWRSVAYGNGVWIAVSADGTNRVMRSTNDGVTWTAVAAAAANAWLSVAYGDGVWVAVANSGTNRVMRSTDGGVTWSTVTVPLSPWRSVAYGDGVWVAVAAFDGSRVMRSTNGGVNWTAVSTVLNVSWRSVAYGDGVWVAVSSDGTNRAMRSTDGGVGWSRIFVDRIQWISVAYGEGAWVAVATAFDGSRVMRSSVTKGFHVDIYPSGNTTPLVRSEVIAILDTSVSPSITANTTDIVEGNAVTFTIDTNSSTNFDGNTTLFYTLSTTMIASDFAGNVLPSGNVVITNNTGTVTVTTITDVLPEGDETFRLAVRRDSTAGPVIAVSEIITVRDLPPTVRTIANTVNEGDSITFTVTTENVADQTLRFRTFSNTSTGLSSVTADNFDNISGVNPFNNFVNFSLVNNQGTFTVPIKRDFLTTGGSTWSTHSATAAISWRSIAYGSGVWVAVSQDGTNRVMRSEDDGVTWTSVAAAQANQWLSVAYGDGVWIAVSFNGTNRVMRSEDDGVTWTAVAAAEANGWLSVAYGDGVWVAVAFDGGSRVMRSEDDGVTWTAVAAAEANGWLSVAYGDGVWVAVANSGTNRVMRSTDGGVSWTAVAAAEANAWRSVAYGDGVWVAVASTGVRRTMRSTDGGVTWTAVAAAAANAWQSVAYGDGMWIAVAGDGSSRVMRSDSGGVSWSAVTVPPSSWISVAYGDGVWVALAFSGTNRVIRSSVTKGFHVDIYPSGNTTPLVRSEVIAILDTSVSPSITANTTDIVEGNAVTFTIDTSDSTNFDGNTTLFYTLSTTMNANDFAGNVLPSGNVVITNNTGTVTVSTRVDMADIGFFEGDETFRLAVRIDSTTGPVIQTSEIITVRDLSPQYTVTAAANTVNEGDSITFTVTTENVADGIMRFQVANDTGFGIVDANDFSDTNNPFSVPRSVSLVNGSATFNVNTKIDFRNSVSWNWAATMIPLYNVVAYGDGVWIGVAGNRVIRSTDDGVTWSDVIVPDGGWRSVAYGNGVWVAVASSGTNRVMRSTDGGVTWNAVGSPLLNPIDVAYGNGVWIAVGNSRAMRSTDGGITWSASNLLGATHDRIATNGNGTWIATSVTNYNFSVVIRSTNNGVTWASIGGQFSIQPCSDVYYGDGTWIVLQQYPKTSSGNSGIFRSKNDGISWTQMTLSNDISSPSLSRVSFGNGVWIIKSISNLIRSQDDGVTWDKIPTDPAFRNIFGLAFGGNKWLARGEFAIFRSAPDTNSAFRVNIMPSGTTTVLATSGLVTLVEDSNVIVKITASSNTVTEGNAVTFTIDTSDSTSPNFTGNATLHYSLRAETGSITASDFAGNVLPTGNVVITNNTGTITVTTRSDGVAEANDSFVLLLRTANAGPVIAVSEVITIVDP
jgi:hypothetical protein